MIGNVKAARVRWVNGKVIWGKVVKGKKTLRLVLEMVR